MRAPSDLFAAGGAPEPIHQGAMLPARDGLEVPRILVNEERCVGCQECVIRCPTGALDIDAQSWKATGDDGACVGCRQCVRTCPYGAIEIDGPLLAAPRVQVEPVAPVALIGHIQPTRPGLQYAEAMREAERCLQCPDPTCVLGCPAHNDIPAFIAAIRDEDFGQAHAVLRETSIMPDICSIVCDQSLQCEGACSWKLAGGEAVSIGMLERFVTEQMPVPELQRAAPADAAKRVAVVGSGPAGMAAAWELLEQGAHVTMVEREPVTGGVLAWGIPDFTLPERVARRPMEALERAGLEVRTGVEVDDGALARLREEFDAVVLAHGASNPSRLPVPGAAGEGVEDATSFLRRAKRALLSGTPRLDDLSAGKHILVVGAGNTAMDVARSARRLGLVVTAIDWFDRRFAAVRDDELLEAEHEGLAIHFNRVLERFDVDEHGRVVAARVQHTRQPRRTAMPKAMPKTSERLAVDHVVLATGYRVGGPAPIGSSTSLPATVPDLERLVPERTLTGSGLPAGSARVASLVRRRAYLEHRAAEPLTDALWVAGDGLSGPSTVVGSMAQGLAAARATLRSMRGDDAVARDAIDRSQGAAVTSRRRRRNADRPAATDAHGWLPRWLLVMGLVVEAAGLVLAAVTRSWFPAAVFLGAGVIGALAGLNGWVGGWVRAQER